LFLTFIIEQGGIMDRRHRIFALVLAMALALILAAPVMAADEAGKININTATAEELAQLNRIGPSYAARIVAFRENNGPFKAPEDVMMVPGIGQKTFDLNKDRISVD
jgi:competence protein ComEA